MRSEFEAWAMSVMNPNLDRYGDGQYRAPHIEIAWSAWQAATKAASEVCMEWRAGCDNRSMQGEGWAAAECAQAIMERMEMPNAVAGPVEPTFSPAGYNRPPTGEPTCLDDWNAGYEAGMADGMEAARSEVGRLRAELADAIHAMRAYARENPRHQHQGQTQDPNGVHAWLARNGA